jgi:(1->4)-alpha-D-glucan 1-alpha-D-glucosylmutase
MPESGAISALARIAGVEERYTDFYGKVQEVPRESVIAILQAIGYPIANDTEATALLKRLRGRRVPWRFDLPAIRRAYLPRQLRERRLWGVTAQLYSLQSRENWGIGDFADLASLARISASRGASCAGVNPLHALELTNPSSASPYSPSSRLHLNALYVNVPLAREMLRIDAPLPVNAALLDSLRSSGTVDYEGVARLKLSALRTLHAAFRSRRGRSPLASEFARFRKASGSALRRFAVYEALMDEFKRSDPHVYGWMQWPMGYRNPNAAHVVEFAESHEQDVEFYEFLQWLADRQLARAADACSALPIGLYRDLAIGADANGADVWADARAFCLDLCVGAPPDPLNTEGQNWQFPPLNPRVLRDRGFAPFAALLRANMRHAGALRIDHAMGLERLFCIPRGMDPSAGTYVNFPREAMFRILIAQSRRMHCAIVGEDLGTVRPGFRNLLQRRHILGTRVLYFERDREGSFRSRDSYDQDAVASVGTHDLPPLAGYWNGTDIAIRTRIGHLTPDAAQREESARSLDRRRLVRFLVQYGQLTNEEAQRLLSAQARADDELLEDLLRSAYRALAQAPSRLALVQLEDVALVREPVNVPGSFDEVPNWHHKLPLSLESLSDDPRFAGIAADMAPRHFSQ